MPPHNFGAHAARRRATLDRPPIDFEAHRRRVVRLAVWGVGFSVALALGLAGAFVWAVVTWRACP